MNGRTWKKSTTDLSETIHSAMITDSDHWFVPDLVIGGGGRTCGVMYHHRRLPTLDDMDRDIVSTAQGENLGFASPYSSIAYGNTILLELWW